MPPLFSQVACVSADDRGPENRLKICFRARPNLCLGFGSLISRYIKASIHSTPHQSSDMGLIGSFAPTHPTTSESPIKMNPFHSNPEHGLPSTGPHAKGGSHHGQPGEFSHCIRLLRKSSQITTWQLKISTRSEPAGQTRLPLSGAPLSKSTIIREAIISPGLTLRPSRY